MNRNVLTSVCTGAGLAVGGVIGFLIAKTMLKKTYQLLMEEEIAKTKEFYSRLYKKDGYETPEKAAQTLGLEVTQAEAVEEEIVVAAATAIRTYRGGTNDSATVLKNIFERTADDEGDEDPPDEADVPVIISQKAFLQNDDEYTQCTVTWFELDSALVDEREELLDDIDTLVGLDNLQRFGQKSKDPNIVYVRNDAMRMDFEILLSKGKYSKEVLGLD